MMDATTSGSDAISFDSIYAHARHVAIVRQGTA
jgi:hypothetical protein